MKGWHNSAGYNRLYVIGAGFSAPAGMPLTNQLLPLVFQHAMSIKTPDSDPELGHAQILLESLRFYIPEFEFDPYKLRVGEIPDGFDFERFLTFMGVNSAIQMGTSEQLDEHGSQELSYFMDWTADVVRQAQMKAARKGLPEVYHKFAQQIEDAMIFTFNWDTILEVSLEKAGRPYQLDRRRQGRHPEIPVLKLHGSIDWFTSDHCLRQPWMKLQPIGESLPSLSRATEPLEKLGLYYDSGMTPWIVVPSFDKIYQVTRYDELWQLLYLYLQNDLTVYFIGFSMRPDDFHTHAILYPQLAHGANDGSIRIRVIDYAEDEAKENEIRSRFKNIPGTEFWFKGFSEEALEFATTG